MIRITPQPRFRISNRAALIAALLLAISSFAGIYSSQAQNGKLDGQDMAVVSQADHNASNGNSNRGKLSISLLLFGRG